MGGTSCEETKLEPIAGGEHSEAVAMGMISTSRGIPHLPCHVIGIYSPERICRDCDNRMKPHDMARMKDKSYGSTTW